MDRHDALSSIAQCEAPPPPTESKKRTRKLAPLLREVAEVKNDTLAFLYGGPDQQPGDYQRNLDLAESIRQDFVQFCTANLHFGNWRQAWAAFMHAQTKPTPRTEPQTLVVNAPAMPRWKQRLQGLVTLQT